MFRAKLLLSLLIFPLAGTLCTGVQAASFSFQKGDIVAGTGNGTYKVFTSNGTFITTLDDTSGSTYDAGGAFDSNGDLFVTNFSKSTVSEFDKNGKLVTATFGGGFDRSPESITINKAGDIFVGQADGTHHVLEFSSSGTLLNTFAPTPQDRGTDWIDLAPDGKTLYYTSEGTSVLRYDISTKTQLTNFADNLPGANAYALRILPNGQILVADTSEAVLLDTAGHVVRTYTAAGLTNAFALNILPDGKSFLTGNLDATGEIFQFNIATGALEQSFASNAATVLGGLIVNGEIGIGPPPPPPTSPEPASVLLLGSGLAVLWTARRKLRRKNQ